MAFKSIFTPSAKRPKTQDAQKPQLTDLAHMLQFNVSITTWLLIGASLQAIAVYLFSNGHYVLLISMTLLSLKLARNYLQAKGILTNPYMQDVIPYRTTALLPNEDTSEITEGASKKITVFHLGAKANHPYGYFAP